MIILGIDPGTARTGWGVIVYNKPSASPSSTNHQEETLGSFSTIGYLAHGCIETPKEAEMTKRLLMVRQNLKQLITQYHPDCVAVERLFFGMNSKTAMTVGQARGVVMVTAAENDIPLFEYQGLEVKKIISGSGKADKRQIQQKVRQILGLSDSLFTFGKKDGGDDAADALAIAICHTMRM